MPANEFAAGKPPVGSPPTRTRIATCPHRRTSGFSLPAANSFAGKHIMKPDKLTTPEQLMCEYAYLGDEMGVLHWLVEGVSPNARDEHGVSAIHRATTIDVLKLLVEAGANLNAGRNEGYTRLHDTVGTEYIEMARHLLRLGADINARNGYGETPLRLAIDTTGTYCVVAPAMARFLIENGADVNARDNDGETILQAASHALSLSTDDEPSREIVQLLHERGAIDD